jgi:dTDP-4-dehydrorhamnose reductase
MRVLIWGAHSGWIGRLIVGAAPVSVEVCIARSRLEDIPAVCAELDAVKPTRVVVAAGLTGRPNVDWCEDHKAEVLGINYAATLQLIRETAEIGIHTTYIGTGCLYTYDAGHPNAKDARGFSERSPHNFDGSYYAYTKGMLERDIQSGETTEKNTCVVRIRLPVDERLDSPRNLMRKLLQHRAHIADGLYNSMTVLEARSLKVLWELIQRRTGGVFNFVNPGPVTNRDICGMYKECVAPSAEFVYMDGVRTLAEHCVAPRSNCILDSDKLRRFCVRAGIPPLDDTMVALRRVFEAASLLE